MSDPTANTPPTPPPKKGGRGDQSSMDRLRKWLGSREGKIVAGGAAVVVVVMLGLRRARAEEGDEETFSAASIQRGEDGTLQERLDQIGMRGGTIEDLIGATTNLTGVTTELADILDTQDPVDGGSNRTNIAGIEGLSEQDLRDHPKVSLAQFRAIDERPDDFARLVANPAAARKFALYDARQRVKRLRRR